MDWQHEKQIYLPWQVFNMHDCRYCDSAFFIRIFVKRYLCLQVFIIIVKNDLCVR